MLSFFLFFFPCAIMYSQRLWPFLFSTSFLAIFFTYIYTDSSFEGDPFPFFSSFTHSCKNLVSQCHYTTPISISPTFSACSIILFVRPSQVFFVDSIMVFFSVSFGPLRLALVFFHPFSLLFFFFAIFINTPTTPKCNFFQFFFF